MTKGKILCSVQILTLNSGKTLKRCLESVKDFAEIIICDGNSTDNTLDIAKEYGCKVVKQEETEKKNIKIKNFSRVRNKCLKAATYDWFFYIDSDDMASPELVEEIRNIVKRNKPPYIYEVPVKVILNGRVVEHYSSYPGRERRFFNRKTNAYFIKPVHERIEFDSEKYEVGRLKSCWYRIWDKDYINNIWHNIQMKHIHLAVASFENKSLYHDLRWAVFDNILRSAKVIIKALRNWLFFGFKKSMPPKIEIIKALYYWRLMLRIIKLRLRNFFRNK